MVLRCLFVTPAFLLVAIASAPLARADPITVTSGSAVVPWDGPGGFGLVGVGLHLSVGPTHAEADDLGALNLCGFSGGCAPGTRVGLSAVFNGGQSFLAIVNGVTFAPRNERVSWIHLDGRIVFDAPDVTVPPLSGEPFSGRVSVVAPFMFHAHLAGFSGRDVGDPPVGTVPFFQVELVGGGTVALTLGREGGNLWAFRELVYTFEDQAAIPEPMSLLLVGSGLAGLLGACRGRRARGVNR